MPRQRDPALTSPQEARVHIHALGRLQVQVAGIPLDIRAKGHTKPLEMLKLLVALGGEGITSERLSEELWPNAEGDKAHGALTTTLYRLRKLIGVNALSLADARLTLQRDQCWVDVWAFTEALKAAEADAAFSDTESAWSHVQQALALYRGPLLDGEFDLPDVMTARAKVHGLFLRHVEELGAFFCATGERQRAIKQYQQGLECDSLAEAFYRHLMECYRQEGRIGDAVALYQRCREALKHGADIEPAPETTALYQSLVTGAEPHNVPSVAASGAEIAQKIPAPDRPPLERPARPSIAVLPFANMSGDPEQSYFSDGISEDIITALSKISGVFVIARTSSFTFKGKSVTVQQVSEALGVRYVLEGSVRKAGNRVRITAQLIDGQSGGQLWADRYDRELEDIFAVQDELVRNIVMELRVKLTDGESARIFQAATGNMQAYEYLLRGQHADWDGHGLMESAAYIREMYEKAISLDPDYALAYALLSIRLWIENRLAWGESMELAKQMAEQAIALDDTQPMGHVARGRVYLMERKYDLAVAECERALALGPNLASVNASYALILRLSGRPEEAIVVMKNAMRLAPYYPVSYLTTLGECYRLIGRLEEAVVALRGSVDGGFGIATPRVFLITALVELDRMEEARVEAVRLMELEPMFNIETWAKRALPYKNQAETERIITLCRKAGLPE